MYAFAVRECWTCMPTEPSATRMKRSCASRSTSRNLMPRSGAVENSSCVADRHGGWRRCARRDASRRNPLRSRHNDGGSPGRGRRDSKRERERSARAAPKLTRYEHCRSRTRCRRSQVLLGLDSVSMGIWMFRNDVKDRRHMQLGIIGVGLLMPRAAAAPIRTDARGQGA
jgi:hypothetical protein